MKGKEKGEICFESNEMKNNDVEMIRNILPR